MAYLQEKLDNFTQNVIKEAVETRDLLNAETSDEIKRRTDSIKLEVCSRCNEKIQSEMAKIKKENNEKISRRVLESKKQILKTREDILNKVFDEVLLEIDKFIITDEYLNFLIRTIEKGIEEIGAGSYEVYLLERDLKYKDEIEKKISNLVFSASNENILGGAKLFNATKQTIYDGSILKAIESLRRDFIKEIGSVC